MSTDSLHPTGGGYTLAVSYCPNHPGHPGPMALARACSRIARGLGATVRVRRTTSRDRAWRALSPGGADLLYRARPGGSAR
ncbi:hypothetical protein AB0H73_38035 [Streptomyces olivoreticuli]